MSITEQTLAIQETYDIIQEYGRNIDIISQTETQRSYDKFGSPKKVVESSSKTVKAFPIRFNPSEKEIREAGLDDKVDLILYVSSKEISDESIEFDVLRDRIRLDGSEYKFQGSRALRENGHFGTSFRSWVLGLVNP